MNTITKLLVVAVIVGGVAFFDGMKYGQANVKNNFQANIAGGLPSGAMGRTGGANGASGLISGDIIAKDTQSVTIKMRDGSSKIVLYSASTEVSKFDAGITTDLVIGKTVSITGTANTDGSITAKTIQIRPLPTSIPNQ